MAAAEDNPVAGRTGVGRIAVAGRRDRSRAGHRRSIAGPGEVDRSPVGPGEDSRPEDTGTGPGVGPGSRSCIVDRRGRTCWMVGECM